MVSRLVNPSEKVKLSVPGCLDYHLETSFKTYEIIFRFKQQDAKPAGHCGKLYTPSSAYGQTEAPGILNQTQSRHVARYFTGASLHCSGKDLCHLAGVGWVLPAIRHEAPEDEKCPGYGRSIIRD